MKKFYNIECNTVLQEASFQLLFSVGNQYEDTPFV